MMSTEKEKEKQGKGRLGRNGIGIVRGVDVGTYVMRSVPLLP
jgi:hypothetical protein